MARIDGFQRGMDNIHQDNELGSDTARRIVNMDITDSGKLRMRKGRQRVLELGGAHSMWDDNAGNAYLVHDNKIKKFNADGTLTIIGTFNAGANRASFLALNGDIYVSCATASAIIRNGALIPWGVEVPASAPALSLTTGQLTAGAYHLAMTYVMADGRESGASLLSSITLNSVGGIATTALPVPDSADVAKKRLYMSTPNGEVPYLAKELSPLDQFTTIMTMPVGVELRTAYQSPPPFAIGLTYSNGCIFMIDAADPTVVWRTNALDYDHVDRRKNYYKFGAEVTVIAGTKGGGLYVCADQTRFIGQAGTMSPVLTEVFEFGGIANTARIIPRTNEYIWMSERGPVIGHEAGAAEILAEKALAPGLMINAASMVREQDGIRQFVVVGNNSEGSILQAGSYAEAEITRRAR